MSTCNRLDLQMLGSQPNMPNNLPMTVILGVVTHWPGRTDWQKNQFKFKTSGKITDPFRLKNPYNTLRLNKSKRTEKCRNMSTWIRSVSEALRISSSHLCTRILPGHCRDNYTKGSHSTLTTCLPFMCLQAVDRMEMESGWFPKAY